MTYALPRRGLREARALRIVTEFDRYPTVTTEGTYTHSG